MHTSTLARRFRSPLSAPPMLPDCLQTPAQQQSLIPGSRRLQAVPASMLAVAHAWAG